MTTAEQGVRDRRAAANLWRCKAAATKAARRGADWEDIYSAALVALAEAVERFRDRDGGADREAGDERFGLFAHIHIRGRVEDALHGRAPKGYRRRKGLPRPAMPEVLPLSSLARRPGDEADAADPPGAEMEWEEAVVALSRTLPPRHGELLRCRYLHADAADSAGCARRLGLSVSTVNQYHAELIGMLRVKASRCDYLRGA